MKISVSLPENAVQLLDDIAEQQGLASRSAAVAKALQIYRELQLGDAYEQAWKEWDESGDAEFWAATVGGGITEESR
ncbi:ribbon-helix-helix protein, CopG family [Nesterenkonia sp. MY13]|uniref:Ribbon-helix-helix protein, CopG family n=1 Tax=Nesterenkonia sedimenti TaxID=1463632 RepID=A0A7X8TI42_9MICC|nr:ribbon-helix-helix protein, CopG family [Nesterenkonia sedimenti]NLS09170.1 ribbon-helix-helix protein, CopG family [Nesterenkonia sedimenti]